MTIPVLASGAKLTSTVMDLIANHLNNDLPDLVQAGTWSFSAPSGLNTPQSSTITFTTAFATAPYVLITPFASNPQNWSVSITNMATTTAFTVRTAQTSGSLAALTGLWVAIAI